MPKLTSEQQEVENFIRMAAVQAQAWQAAITKDEDLEKWFADGHWTYLRAKVMDEIEREAFNTLKNPSFDPTNVAQVSQLQAFCRTIDLIEGKIKQRVAMVQDARDKLRDLEASTPRDEEGESNGN